MADVLNEILRAANKHPNSRVSKLIHTVEEEPSQKNIVLLLIELAEHAEYSTDFNVSLKYYLDLFERLGINHDLVLNEAGLLLVNSSKIYSKRVDYVQSLVERQILTLSNADDELQKQKLEQQQAENATPAEKPKRGRKRALEVPSDPYEVELVPKKFKKLSEEKRFAQPKTPTKPKSIQRNIEMEQHIHPAGWLHATICDLENEEDVDTKRNYKLFTYHIEHRYNTLVPDINFRLHFKVKDYMDEQEEMEDDEACNTDRTWPPLSEAYVQKYIRLENYVLQQEVKANKRKAGEMEDNSQELRESLREDNEEDLNKNVEKITEDLNNSNSINSTTIEQNLLVNGELKAEDETANLTATGLEQSLLNASQDGEANKTQENLDASNLNGKNDSGLGQSILDETNNTLNNTQLNSTLEISSSPENLNNSGLGQSILDETNNTQLNSTLEISSSPEHLNNSSVHPEANKSLNTTDNSQENDSALGSSLLDQTNTVENNTTMETTGNLDATNITDNLNDTNLNNSKSQQENDSALSASVLEQTSNTENNTTLETSAEISTILETTQKEADEKDQTEELSKATENRKDSALSDDRHHSISTENLAMSREYLNTIDEETGDKTLDTNVKQHENKDTTQIHVQLPHTDDEGVCLSDLEDHNDCRLLSPIIKATNILPGVERKDITIFMDEELRQALEMRDGIMEHFGPETYKVPVITEAKKHNLLFNILKLPEKVVRRKVIFKLGPEMDLYLQARSLKRSKPEPAVPRTFRNTQFLQWHSLNNTDMTGICMTPPSSPGHCSDFYGFSDQEDNDDDTVSCAEFCGFTEEEQSSLVVKHISRLSRDSGVGVDVNNLTPEKETLDIIFEETETSAVDNCKHNLNLDEAANEENTDNILKQLPEDIRDVLTTELQGDNENKSHENSENKEKDLENSSSDNSEEMQNLSTESSLKNTEETEKLLTESSQENSETLTTENSETLTSDNSETNNTKESNVLSENATEDTLTLQEQSAENSEPFTGNESKDKSTDNVHETLTNTDVNMDANDKVIESAEQMLKAKLDLANSMEEDNDNFDDHHVHHLENDDSDDEMLDLDTQGSKTKIQQWHEHLQPILAKSRERHHFDVFQLGTEIIDTVQSKRESHQEEQLINSSPAPPNKPIATFHDIMDNKDQSYVSRYFLSTLLLANQSNIEISIDNKSSEKPSSWHDIHLKLLSTKRHTVAIEDNIGMIDNKLKSKEKNIKTNAKEKGKQNKNSSKREESDDDEEEEGDDPLIKRQSTKTPKKSSKKRNINYTSPIAEKKSKQIITNTTHPTTTNCRPNKLPNLIESVQIIKSSQTTPKDMLIMSMPSTSQQAQNFNNTLSNIAIRTLQPIKKVQKRSDDYDSGIFSIDEMSTS